MATNSGLIYESSEKDAFFQLRKFMPVPDAGGSLVYNYIVSVFQKDTPCSVYGCPTNRALPVAG